MVLLDLHLGHESAGWRPLERLWLDPATGDIPVLLCTTHSRLPAALKAWQRRRGVELLVKPFTIDDLVAQVGAMIGPPVPVWRGLSNMYQREHIVLPASVIHEHVKTLYQLGNDGGGSRELLQKAFEELEIALEALRAAEERLKARDEAHLTEQAELEQAYQHYHDLFLYAPAGYLITSLDGTIRQANAAAERLLCTSERSMVGRSLANFVPEGRRRPFHGAIAELHDAGEGRIWEYSLQPWEGPAFDALLCVTVARAPSGRPQALRWLVLPKS